MNDFKRNRVYGGGGGRDRGGDRDRQMHPATCDECGKRCEVPFKPTGDKPIYCNECFKSAGKSGGRDRGGRDFGGGGRDRGRGRSDFGEKRMHKAICAECGDRCEVPFKPSGDKPVLCSRCFGGGGSAGPVKSEKESVKHDEILSKLNKILTILQRTNPVKEITVMKEKSMPKKVETSNGASKEAKETKKTVKKAVKKTPAKKKTVKKVEKHVPTKAEGKKVVKKAVKPKAKKTKK